MRYPLASALRQRLDGLGNQECFALLLCNTSNSLVDRELYSSANINLVLVARSQAKIAAKFMQQYSKRRFKNAFAVQLGYQEE